MQIAYRRRNQVFKSVQGGRLEKFKDGVMKLIMRIGITQDKAGEIDYIIKSSLNDIS